MTDTELKLQDAAAQMRLALKHIEDDDTLRSCINSFISHGRSVTFVMQAESSAYPSLLAWYKAQMDVLSKVALMRFFNEKRVHTTHRGVINTDPRKASLAAGRLRAIR